MYMANVALANGARLLAGVVNGPSGRLLYVLYPSQHGTALPED